MEFIQRAVSDAAEFFIKNQANELYLQKTISTDSMKKLEDQVAEFKAEIQKTKDSFEAKMRTTETEKAELAAKEQSLREQFHQI